jgi:hypothetical protein
MTSYRTKPIWAALVLAAATIVLLIVRVDRAAQQTRAEIRSVEKKRLAVETKLAKARATPPPAFIPRTEEPAPAATPPPKTAQQTEAEALLTRENQRRALLQAWTAQAYAPFFRAAALSPGQVEAFKTAMIAHFLRWSEIVDAGRGQGLAAADQSVWKELGKKEDVQFREEQREALGPDAFLQLRQYERTAPLKPVADAVAGAVFDSEPLTADAAETLIRVLANNSPRFKNGGRASLDDLDLPSALAQLEGALTPRQLAALQTSLAARDAIRKLSLSLAKARKAEGN